MENLNENHEKDFSMEKAELENELTREIEDEIRNNDFLDFDELEEELRKEVEAQLSELKILEENKEKIGNPESLGEIIKNVVWEQFINQIGGKAGEDFIKRNKQLMSKMNDEAFIQTTITDDDVDRYGLDLRKEAHIQTTENFADGNIAKHNTEIDYQQRYDDWQNNFKRDENGNIVKRTVDSWFYNEEWIFNNEWRREKSRAIMYSRSNRNSNGNYFNTGKSGNVINICVTLQLIAA